MTRKNKHLGFTLVELLVSISIIVMLASVAFALLSDARNRSLATTDIDLLKQIEKALNIYDTETGSLPAPADYAEAGPLWICADDSTNDTNGNGKKFVDFLVGAGLQGQPADPRSASVFYYIKGGATDGCGCNLPARFTYLLAAFNLKKAVSGLTDNDAGDNPSLIDPACGLGGPNNYVILGQ